MLLFVVGIVVFVVDRGIPYSWYSVYYYIISIIILLVLLYYLYIIILLVSITAVPKLILDNDQPTRIRKNKYIFFVIL